MDELLGTAGLQVSAGGLVVLIVMLILAGRLVPRRQLEDLRRDKNDQLRDKQTELDVWKKVAQDESAARRDLQAQNAQLMEFSRVGAHVLGALPTTQGVTASAPMDQAPAASP